mgnify:CR=1 FL=1
MSHNFNDLILKKSYMNNSSTASQSNFTLDLKPNTKYMLYKNTEYTPKLTTSLTLGDGFIKGTIKEKEKIYPFCTVILFSLRDYITVCSTTSDTEGNFYIDNLAKDTSYILIALDRNNKYKNIISETIVL